MNKTLLSILVGLLAGSAGFVAGFSVTKKKYEKIRAKEIASWKAMQAEHDENLLKQYGVDKEAFKKKAQATPRAKKAEPLKPVKPNADRSDEKDDPSHQEVLKNNYDAAMERYGASSGGGRRTNNKLDPNIYVMTDEQYNNSQCNVQTLKYWSDGVVTDEDNNLVANFEDYIGPIQTWSNCFNKNVEVIYIRNDHRETDYEVVKQESAWKKEASKDQQDSMLDITDDDGDEY